eukprot:9005245-Heterocapsa_arctica.AAC.1
MAKQEVNKGDREMVMEAGKSNGEALRYASAGTKTENIKNDINKYKKMNQDVNKFNLCVRRKKPRSS